MIKTTLFICRIYMKRLNKLNEKKQKIKNKETLANCQRDIEEIKEQAIIWKKRAEKCIESLDISESEKEFARNYYTKTNSWDYAYSESRLRQELSLKTSDGPFDSKYFEAMKKHISRRIDQF